jgi:hypothetical protein
VGRLDLWDLVKLQLQGDCCSASLHLKLPLPAHTPLPELQGYQRPPSLSTFEVTADLQAPPWAPLPA